MNYYSLCAVLWSLKMFDLMQPGGSDGEFYYMFQQPGNCEILAWQYLSSNSSPPNLKLRAYKSEINSSPSGFEQMLCQFGTQLHSDQVLDKLTANLNS